MDRPGGIWPAEKIEQQGLTSRSGSAILSALPRQASWRCGLSSIVKSDPRSHAGSFFGNAIADWTGVVITVLATKWFFEKGSRESRKPKITHKNRVLELLHEHSLTIFLVVTGIGWVALSLQLDPESKWGTVVSNMVSEWSQQIGLVLLTKRLIETGSKESSDNG